MWVTAASGVPVDTFTPSGSSWYNANNRLMNAGLGIGYDAGGNLQTIGAYNLTYDGENRQVAYTNGGVTTNYAYDGDGRRVMKTQGLATTTYVYDASGQLAAEYSAQPNQSPCATCYLTADHLGSTRMMTDASGAVKSLHDYLPFGEEVPASIGGRSGTYYPASTLAINDGTTQKFTSKERDAESLLDYFGARYFSGAQGRWTTPDWSAKPEPVPYADLKDPQSLNLYAYVKNNPMKNRDLDGHFCIFGWGTTCKVDPPKPPPPPPAPVNPVFPTPDAAAIAAARMNQQKQKQTGSEHASSLYAIGTAYTYTNPVTQNKPRRVDPNNTTGYFSPVSADLSKAPIPPGTQLVGETHSHPDMGSFSGYDTQRADQMILPFYGHPLYQGFYVGLPDNSVEKYSPQTGQPSTVAVGEDEE
jgi:RHS repeat-associated protein